MIDIKKALLPSLFLLLAAPAAAEPWSAPAAPLLSLRFQSAQGAREKALKDAGGDAEKARALLARRIAGETDAAAREALKEALRGLPRLKIILSLPFPARAGQPLSLRVRVRNISLDPVQAVRSLDGSWAGQRKPEYRVSVVGPGGRPVALPRIRTCGNVNPLGKGDFAALAPGAEFDPFGPGSFGNPQLELWRPSVPGKYRVKVVVDYGSTDPADWNSRLNGPVSQDVSDMLKLVPNGVYEAELELQVL